MTFSMTLRAAVRLVTVMAGTILGIILCSAAALADGPVTTTAPQTTTPTAGVPAQAGPAPATSGTTQSAGGVSVQIQVSGAAPTQNSNEGSPVQAQASVQIPAQAGPQMPVQAAPQAPVQTSAPTASSAGRAGTKSSGATVTVSTGSSSAPAAVPQSPPTVSGAGGAAAAPAPAVQVQAQGAGQSISNTTSAPTAAAVTNCTYAGVAAGGTACGSQGRATAVAFAPTTVRAATAPSSTTGARALGIPVRNSVSAPTGVSAATCPVVGAGVHGYGCGNPGKAAVVAFAPTHLHGSTAPAASTALGAGRLQVRNSTAAPAEASAGSCPLVGVAVHGYGCGERTGSGASVVSAPTHAGIRGQPATSTEAEVVGQRVNNRTSAPAGATAATCPLAGIAVHGYGCGRPGSATGAVFAPTRAQGGAAPATATQAQVLGQPLTNRTAAPTSVNLESCPLVGVAVRGYGCGQPGSALGVIALPAGAGTSVAPSSTSESSLLGQNVNNTTSVPAGESLQTCPVIGIAVHGYGCGNPGSGLGVIFAPTTVGGTATPNSTTGTSLLGLPVNTTTSAPTALGLSTCPLIGVDVHGYGCGEPGSATSVVSAPTSGTLGSQPSTGNQTPLGSSTVGTPTNVGLSLCPIAGINVTGYGCGESGNGTTPPGSQPGGGSNSGNTGGGSNGGNPGSTTTTTPGGGTMTNSPSGGTTINTPGNGTQGLTPGGTPGQLNPGVTVGPNPPGDTTPPQNPGGNSGHTPWPSTSTGPNPLVPSVGTRPPSTSTTPPSTTTSPPSTTTSTGVSIVPVSSSPTGPANGSGSGAPSGSSTPGQHRPGSPAGNEAPPAGGPTPNGSRPPTGYPAAPPVAVPASPATFTIPRQPGAGTPSGSGGGSIHSAAYGAAPTGFAGGALGTLPRTGGGDGSTPNDPPGLPIGLLLLAWLLLGAGALTRFVGTRMR